VNDNLPDPAARLRFLGNVQRVLDEGSFVSSYKFALLTALADLSVEQATSTDGTLAIPLSTLAERFIELYWRQAAPFRGGDILMQNTGRQAAVVKAVANFREQAGNLVAARRASRWHALVERVGSVLLEMPLWKLQTVGQSKVIFLYDEVLVDDAIVLKPGVAQSFRDLYAVIEALVQMAWLRFIQRLPKNQKIVGQGTDLVEFLFGADRSALAALGERLRALHGGECFYCRGAVRTGGELDHFVPWVRYPRDLGHNFVFAHGSCNRDKSDLLADVPHLARWVERNERGGRVLSELFDATHVLYDLVTTTRVADWCYGLVERSQGQVWVEKGKTRALDGPWRELLRA